MYDEVTACAFEVAPRCRLVYYLASNPNFRNKTTLTTFAQCRSIISRDISPSGPSVIELLTLASSHLCCDAVVARWLSLSHARIAFLASRTALPLPVAVRSPLLSLVIPFPVSESLVMFAFYPQSQTLPLTLHPPRPLLRLQLLPFRSPRTLTTNSPRLTAA